MILKKAGSTLGLPSTSLCHVQAILAVCVEISMTTSSLTVWTLASTPVPVSGQGCGQSYSHAAQVTTIRAKREIFYPQGQ